MSSLIFPGNIANATSIQTLHGEGLVPPERALFCDNSLCRRGPIQLSSFNGRFYCAACNAMQNFIVTCAHEACETKMCSSSFPGASNQDVHGAYAVFCSREHAGVGEVGVGEARKEMEKAKVPTIRLPNLPVSQPAHSAPKPHTITKWLSSLGLPERWNSVANKFNVVKSKNTLNGRDYVIRVVLTLDEADEMLRLGVDPKIISPIVTGEYKLMVIIAGCMVQSQEEMVDYIGDCSFEEDANGQRKRKNDNFLKHVHDCYLKTTKRLPYFSKERVKTLAEEEEEEREERREEGREEGREEELFPEPMEIENDIPTQPAQSTQPAQPKKAGRKQTTQVIREWLKEKGFRAVEIENISKFKGDDGIREHDCKTKNKRDGKHYTWTCIDESQKAQILEANATAEISPSFYTNQYLVLTSKNENQNQEMDKEIMEGVECHFPEPPPPNLKRHKVFVK